MADEPEITEEWTMRYRIDGGELVLGGDVGHVFESRAEAERHIVAWRKIYPNSTYTDVSYLRRQVTHGPWEEETGSAPIPIRRRSSEERLAYLAAKRDELVRVDGDAAMIEFLGQLIADEVGSADG